MIASDWREKGMNVCLMGVEFQFCKMKSFEDLLQNNVNVFNTAELYSQQ